MFLAPIAGLIAAGLTVPAVIAFYLLKLRRRPVRVGSVMFWERAVRDAQGNAPWRMVRPQAQLLLQLLGLALLLLAFARPVVPGELGGRVMLVLDRSASMRATDGSEGITRFEQARDVLRSMAADLAAASNTRVMIVALGAEALPATPWTSDRAVLLGAIDALEPTDEEASSDALVQLVRLAASGQDAADAGVDGTTEAPDEPETLTIVLASDGDLPEPRDPLPANVIVRLESVGGAGQEPATNVGIVAVAAQRLYDDPAAVRVFVRVQAVGVAQRDVPVRLALNGRVVAEGVARLLPEEDAPTTQASVTLSTVAPEAGVLTVLLPGEDALAADDSASLWLRTAGRPRVLLVVPETEVIDPDASGPPSPVLLISAVLEAMDLGSLRAVRLSRYEQLASAGELPFDTIVFDRVSPTAPPPVSSLHFGPPPPGVRGGAFRGADAGEMPGTRVISWRRTHPVLRDVALDQLAVAEPLIAPVGEERGGGGAQDAEGGASTVLASGERGPLIVGYDAQQHRRIWVGFEPARSNWPKLVSFPLFIAEAVDYLSLRGARDAAEGVRAGQVATLQLAEPRSRVRLVGPEGDYELTSSTPTARPSIGPVDRAGVYLLQDARPGDQRAVAVNVASELESRIGVRAELPAGLAGLPQAQAGAMRRGGERELWPWFLTAGLVVLTLEWFLSARSLGR